MGILSKAADFFTGGAFSGVVDGAMDIIRDQFPEKLSEVEEKQFEMALRELIHRQESESLRLWNEQERAFLAHVKEMEGTAADLRAVPVLGPLILFLRGCLRPAITVGVFVIDWQVFSGQWHLLAASADGPSAGVQLQTLLFALNLIVLSSLFGERAIRNVLPLFERLMAAKRG